MNASDHKLIRAFSEMAVVLIIGLLAGFSNNAISSRSIPLVGRWDKAYGVPSAGGAHDTTRGNIEINGKDALRFFQEGAVFLDARPVEAYAEGHIRGAYSVPEKQLPEKMEELLAMVETEGEAPESHDDAGQVQRDRATGGMLEGGRKVVVYCQSMECDEAHLLARALREAGIKEIFVFAGGMKEWEAAGYPVEKSASAEAPLVEPAAPNES